MLIIELPHKFTHLVGSPGFLTLPDLKGFSEAHETKLISDGRFHNVGATIEKAHCLGQG